MKENFNVKNLPQGEWVLDGVFRMEQRFRWGMEYGGKTLENPVGTSEILAEYGAYKSPVYLDLETTGLFADKGDYAFLVGLGLCEKDYLKVVQLFLTGPEFEGNWLAQIENELPNENYGLATYNGEKFDLPMLKIRYENAEIQPKWGDVPHLDLLKLSRKFYRGKLEDCSLGTIEQEVLGLKRTDEDIPGKFIPAIYNYFLKTQDAKPFEGIFYHNTLDIVSLAAFQNHVATLF